MMRRPMLAAAASLTTVALFSACGTTTEPQPGSFSEHRGYVLRQMAGEALPGVVTSPGRTFRIDADTLRLNPDGTGSQVTIVFVEPVDGEPGEERWTSQFTYVVRGNRFELSFVCPPNALCLAPPHYRGTITSDRLRIDQAPGLPTPLEYERRGGIM